MKLKTLGKRASILLFEMMQPFGFFVLPVHYYVPLASTRVLRTRRPKWNRPFDVSPINMSLGDQIETLLKRIAPYEPEYRGNAVYNDAVRQGAGSGFGYIEAQALYGMIRSLAPRRIIEVGCGVSTVCMRAAIGRNESEERGSTELTCIEPYPSNALAYGKLRPIRQFVEDIDLAFFDQLDDGDVLSIDSCHAVRPCGDVSRLYLEIIPRLKPGVYIHIHDIYFPYLFQRDVDVTYMQWMETALLAALLAHSARYRVILSLSHLHYAATEALKKAFPEYVPQPNDGGLKGPAARQDGSDHFPSSAYIRIEG